jgi:hypothetical protein
MASIKYIDFNSEGVAITLNATEEEYKMLRTFTTNLVILPTDDEAMELKLTTGKLGNGNRIMVPNKLLKRHQIPALRKKCPAKIFEVNKEKYLLIKLEKSELIPEFEKEERI